MSETATGSADLVDTAPDPLRERYELRMAERRRAWRDAWGRDDLLPVHAEDGLVEAHRVAWQEACALAARTDPAWDPTPLDEGVLEAVLLSAQLGLWAPHTDVPGELTWADVHLALYRQTRLGDAPPTPLAVLLHRSLRVSLPKTLDRVVRRAQEAAESLGMVGQS